jgi:outer membrane protein TolC
MTKKVVVIWVLGIIVLGLSYNIIQAQSDSTIFSYKEYLDNITQFHPIAKTADLKIKLAKAELLSVKGYLDPEIESDWNHKNFDNKLYYRQYQTKLKIPTPLGIDFSAGYENTEGIFLNPENNTDEFGLWHLGVEVNLLQGLWVNERRTALNQAKIYQDLAQNERQIILNELIYDATETYLFWQQYHYYGEVLFENSSIANTYFQNTKQSFFGGEKSAMDTLEAFILYQDAMLLLQQNDLLLLKAKQNLENYLWFNDLPVALQENIRPDSYVDPILFDFQNIESAAITSHPLIQASVNKLTMLELEQKLNREMLKPNLKVKYNPLLATSPNSIAPSFSINDYKFGFDFSMPLMFRSERAAIQKGEIKIMESQLDIENKTNELQNKIENSWQQQLLLQAQLTLLNFNVENYKRLLEGEREKFIFGESSVFLLNKRQEKFIDGQLKLIESHIKQQIEVLKFLYYSNQLIIE